VAWRIRGGNSDGSSQRGRLYGAELSSEADPDRGAFPAGRLHRFPGAGHRQRFTEAWGQQVVIDNRSGAGGVVGTEIVATAAPDGYNLLLNAIGHVANPSLYKKLPYDTLHDFSPVTLVADVPTLLVVHPQVKVTTVKELIALARAKPGQLNVAAGGVGASSHLAAELFRSQAQIEWQNIQFKGGGPAFLEVISGRVDLMFSPVASSAQHVTAGRLRALGVTSAKRVPLMPELADDSRGRTAGLRIPGVVRGGGAGQSAEGHRGQAAQRDQRSLARSEVSRSHAVPRRRADRRQAAKSSDGSCSRNQQVRSSGESRRHPAGIGASMSGKMAVAPEPAKEQSLTEQIAAYWSGVRYEDLPAPVVAMAKSVLLDTLSVGVRGAGSEAVTAVHKGIANALECSKGSASLWGRHDTLPASAAALVNGTAAHAL